MNIIKELQKDGMLLSQIPKKEQTIELCKTAIKQNPLALKFASKKYLNSKICLAAVKKDGRVFRYVPKQFITKKMCELAVEADPKLLSNVPEEFRTMFDSNTRIELIEKVVTYNPEWLKYMPNRPDVRALCIKCMEKNFSVAQHMPEQIKSSQDILTYQMSKGKLQFYEKYYDSEEKVFIVKVKVICTNRKSTSGDAEHSYCVLVKFEDFNEFYDFLGGDLFDAELGNYSFYGINLRQYNIKGAVINNKILQAQGLYDGTYFENIKKELDNETDKIMGNNEVITCNDICYVKPIDDGQHKLFDAEHIPFFYISDIHLTYRVYNYFKDKATKEEIRSYIKYLAKSMVLSIGTKPIGSYLLIAGDASSNFEFIDIFYNELIRWWSPSRIVVVAGNHELWNSYAIIGNGVKIYRNFFDKLGIIFLQNDLISVDNKGICERFSEAEILKMSKDEIRQRTLYSPIIILGGIGLGRLDAEFNACKRRYEKSSDEALQKDIQEANRFSIIYKKILESLFNKRIIVLTHFKKEDWNEEAYNPHWIYLNGHDHRNFYEVSNKRVIYADNQIGRRAKSIGLKYFYCDKDYDIFAYYSDGVYKITKEQYIDFNRGKLVSMSYKREDGVIYMIKRNREYLFLIYVQYSEKSKEKFLYLMNGGKLVRLRRNRLEDLSYYYDNLGRYSENVNQLLYKYIGGQQQLSEFIKHLGGYGKIHGCIVDVEKPNKFERFSYCHLFVNPLDGKVTPYFANDVKSRIVYKDLKALLQAHDSCKLMANNYLQFEKEAMDNLPMVQYSGQMEEWGNDDTMHDEGSYLYRISRIIKSLQYCLEKNIVRLWNEELLDYDFVNRIKQSHQIDEIVDDRLMIDE